MRAYLNGRCSFRIKGDRFAQEPTNLMNEKPVNIFDYEAIAQARLGQAEYDFIAGGANDEITLRRTRAMFDSIMMRPRMMVDISQRDLGTTVMGQKIQIPILLDPAGNHAIAHPDAEVAKTWRRLLPGRCGSSPTSSKTAA